MFQGTGEGSKAYLEVVQSASLCRLYSDWSEKLLL